MHWHAMKRQTDKPRQPSFMVKGVISSKLLKRHSVPVVLKYFELQASLVSMQHNSHCRAPEFRFGGSMPCERVSVWGKISLHFFLKYRATLPFSCKEGATVLLVIVSTYRELVHTHWQPLWKWNAVEWCWNQQNSSFAEQCERREFRC